MKTTASQRAASGRLYKHITGPYYGGHDVIGAKPVPYYPIATRKKMAKDEVQPLSRVELDDVIYLLGNFGYTSSLYRF